MKSFITVLIVFASITSHSQSTDSIRVDTVFSYEIIKPKWLRLFENGSPDIFGGTLPAVNGIENAISVRGFKKSEFTNFARFKYVFLDGNKFGLATQFDTAFIWYGQNDQVKIENGVKQKVFILWEKHIYHNLFVLLESSTAYILVQFIATSETYDTNLPKFEEFLAGLKIKSP